MISAQDEGLVHLPPASFSNAGTALMSFDRKGYDYLTMYVSIGALATNAATLTVISLTDCDTTVVSNFATFTGSSVGANWAIATLGSSIGKFQADLRLRKRYVALNITNATTTVIIGAIGRLSRGAVSHDTAAAQSVSNIANTTAAVSNIVTL